VTNVATTAQTTKLMETLRQQSIDVLKNVLTGRGAAGATIQGADRSE
jgi:hypothetical protein